MWMKKGRSSTVNSPRRTYVFGATVLIVELERELLAGRGVQEAGSFAGVEAASRIDHASEVLLHGNDEGHVVILAV